MEETKMIEIGIVSLVTAALLTFWIVAALRSGTEDARRLNEKKWRKP